MKVSLREAVGSAVNTGNLSGRDAELLNALAVGSTAFGDALWRIKYGGDRRHDTVHVVLRELVRRVHGDPRRVPGPAIEAIAQSALAEWLADRCTVCHGRRYIGTEYGDAKATRDRCPAGCQRNEETGIFAAPGAKLFATVPERFLARLSCQRCAGRGWVPGVSVDASKTRSCPACEGRSRLRMSDAARARAIGVVRAVYDARWSAKYERAIQLLRSCDKRTGMTVANGLRTLDGAPGLDIAAREPIIPGK